MARKARRKAALRSAGKVREGDLLERARALAEDPSLATPICEGPCVLFSPVKAAQRAIPRIHAARDDEAKLLAFAKRGNDLARAYAATLLVAKGEKIPYVAELRVPTGSAPYVVRGKAKPFFLAGLQNHHDRALRLLALMPWVKKRGLHVFSADRGLVCTGRRAAPPQDFVEEEMDELGLAERGQGAWSCGHDEADALVLRWRDAGVEAARCEACAGDESTLERLLRHMAGPKLLAGFEVSARLRPLEGAPVEAAADVPEESSKAYLTGAMHDAALLEAARAARVAALKALPRRLYVAGPRSFGEDADALLAALSPTPAEARALRAALAAHEGPVVLDKPTVARALAELWPQHGLAMLEAAAQSAEVARDLHKANAGPDEAAELVRRAGRRRPGPRLPRGGARGRRARRPGARLRRPPEGRLPRLPPGAGRPQGARVALQPDRARRRRQRRPRRGGASARRAGKLSRRPARGEPARGGDGGVPARGAVALRIGLTFERKSDFTPPPGAPPDAHAEMEADYTIDELAEAIRNAGHEVVMLGSAPRLLSLGA